MKFLKNRGLPVVCVLSILLSLCAVPSYAASGIGSTDALDLDSVGAWESVVQNPVVDFVGALAAEFGVPADSVAVFWGFVDRTVSSSGIGEMSYDDLAIICERYNAFFQTRDAEPIEFIIGEGKRFLNNSLSLCLGIGEVNFEVREWGTSGYFRICETNNNLWVVNSSGQYACAPVTESGTTTGGNHWVDKSTAETNLSKSEVLTGSQLQQVCTMLQVVGEPVYIANFGSKYKAIYRDGREVYANADGFPFVASANDSQWAISQDRNDTTVKENGEIIESVTDNSTHIDLSGMTVTLPDGSINFIDQLIYDESTKSYHIDSHDTYNYETNYYYEWNYYINYTSITYIGQTEEYNKYYEVYYELPDGRDSADLTAEELEQLNVSLDIIPYGRSADDTSLRSLYHFDGDTKDASYWNYCTDFTWNKGSSLTYMDAGVFDGALYLDEKEHDFTITLPSNIGSYDFTLQFRYYQSYTAAPQTDSYLSIGDTQFLKFNGSQFLDGSGTALASTPIGSWNEIALIRDGSTLYYYLNGVCIGSIPINGSLGGQLTFHFGSDQQTYKYFDELRLVYQPMATGGGNYTPTSVPHDTNLALVLPDSAVPVADEYWKIESSAANILDSCGMADWVCVDISDISGLSSSSPSFSYSESSSSWSGAIGYNSVASKYPNWYYYSNITDIGSFSDGTYLSTSPYVDDGTWDQYRNDFGTSNYVRYFPTDGLFSCVGHYDSDEEYTAYMPDGTYTLSMVDIDGNIGSITFTLPLERDWGYTGTSSDEGTVLTEFNGYQFGVVNYLYGASTNRVNTYLVIQPLEYDTQNKFVYLELAEGASTDLTVEKIASVTAIDKEDLNTPTLAVRTDLDITSYQIGGVRPSIPEKGQVWALVESGYITSIQIYTGSAWEACDGRIWTGVRWIPVRSFNIITLQDMYDIVDATPNYEYIYTEAGFWAWWQKSWNSFTEKFFNSVGSGSLGGSSAPSSVKETVSQALSSLIEGIFGVITEVLKSLIGAAADLISGVFGFFSDMVIGGVKDFFSSLGELVNPFQSTVENEDGTTTTITGLPDGVGTVFAFVSGLFMVMPAELHAVMLFGIGLMLLLAVFKKVGA